MFEIDWSINDVTIMLDIHLGRALKLVREPPDAARAGGLESPLNGPRTAIILVAG